MGRRSTTQLWLPNSGKSKTVRFGGLDFFAERGSIFCVDINTGSSWPKTPSEVMKWAEDCSQNLVGKAMSDTAARDRQDLREMKAALEEIFEMAKTELAKNEGAQEVARLINTTTLTGRKATRKDVS